MTRFHVTLDGVEKNDSFKTTDKTADLRSMLSAKGGGIGKNRKLRTQSASIDDKWQHDMYDEAEQSEPKGSSRASGLANDDLRLRLTGPNSSKPKFRSMIVERPGRGNVGKQTVSMVARRLTNAEPVVSFQQSGQAKTGQGSAGRSDQGVAQLLRSLDLEKYISIFSREEVDLDALQCFSDADLQELGVPMGPRKKILAALS
eukprot:CAMPEP_0198218994 /NCGR_PEP_ID=MMETSP1445-20131203/72184_1 /TAXON_ID=36898 /ORGANISM="Pyramimonas sp., Strain CCMP2087" /LENGTH=201 /DNA_ID=CAMNT_0043896269 /DNA_START=115 /DNA_END=720 /DNA_ORIENTATION=-